MRRWRRSRSKRRRRKRRRRKEGGGELKEKDGKSRTCSKQSH